MYEPGALVYQRKPSGGREKLAMARSSDANIGGSELVHSTPTSDWQFCTLVAVADEISAACELQERVTSNAKRIMRYFIASEA